MGKGERHHEAVTEYQWEQINGVKDKGQLALNKFIPVPQIQLNVLDFDKISDIELIASFGKSHTENQIRTTYPFTYLCHATIKDHVDAIEREGIRASKGKTNSEFDDCYFTWWHLYPHDFIYNSPDDVRLKESNRNKKEHLLENVVDVERREKLQNLVINSAMFRVKLFPFLTHNFIASITDIVEEYKSIMECEEIDMKIYGTFLYLDLKRTKYLTEVMYAVIICPKGTERFSSLDNLSNDNDIFQYNAENPLEGAWKWIPYSTSLKGTHNNKRLWDFVGFAFYMKDDQMRLKPSGEWKAREVPIL